jgi:prefoldin subunit 5
MEASLISRKRNLLLKLPDIKKTSEMLNYLISCEENKEFITHFEISDLLYTKAKIHRKDKVHLWLGANVMLEYSLGEAVILLKTNLQTAETSLKQTNVDLNAIKDGMTTLEVSMARVYNYDVHLRRTVEQDKLVVDSITEQINNQ